MNYFKNICVEVFLFTCRLVLCEKKITLCYMCICFYSSMVIRDLTLRSAASFGSFHLIRLLYDEYMFYLVEHKVAAATGETPIAVMGEVRQVCRESKHGPHSVLSLVVQTKDVVVSNLSKTKTVCLMKNTEKALD